MNFKFFKRNKPQLLSDKIAPISFENLPNEIASKLKQSVARVRRIIWVRGLAATLATLFIALILIMAIDAMVVIVNPFIRWGLWVIGVVAVSFTARTMIYKPLSKPFTPRRIAALIEQNHPELEERLSTVVELLATPDAVQEASARFLEVLTDAAIADIKTVTPRKEFTTKTVKPRAILALVTGGLIFILFLIFPSSMGRLLTRAIIPSAEVDNIYADNLSVAPGNKVVLIGDSLNVDLAITGGFPGTAYIGTKAPDRRETRERMSQTSTTTEGEEKVRYYQYFFPSIQEDFKYRVLCGSAVTRFYDVKAVPQPAYTNIQISYQYPSYTGRGIVPLEPGSMDISAIPGTTVLVDVMPNRELDGKIVLPNEVEYTGFDDGEGKISFDFLLNEEIQGQWAVILSDEYGFSNKVNYASIQVVQDKEPTITITEPESQSFELPDFGKLPFSFVAKDDFGFSAIELHLALNEEGSFTKLLDLKAEEVEYGVWTGFDALELQRINIHGAKTVRLQLIAKDNLPESMGGPQIGKSQIITISVERNATSFAGQEIARQHEKINMSLKQVITRLQQSQRLAGEAADLTRQNKNSEDYHEKYLNKLREADFEVVTSIDIMNQLATELSESLYNPMSDEVNLVIMDHIEPCHDEFEECVTLSADEINTKARTIRDKNLKEAIDAVKALEKLIAEHTKELQRLEKINDFAEKEELLAELIEEGKLTPEEIAQMQQEILDEFNREFGEDLKNSFDDEKKKLEDLKKELDALSDKQDELRKNVEKLDSENKEEREKAEKAIKEKTGGDMQEKSMEERVSELEKQIAEEIKKASDQIQEMAEKATQDEKGLKKEESDGGEKDSSNQDKQDQDSQMPSESLDDAKQKNEEAYQEAQEAIENAMKGDNQEAAENMENVSDMLKQAQEQVDKASEAYDKLASQELGQKDQELSDLYDMRSEMENALEAAQEAAEQMQGDPNAERDWEGDPQNPENAEQMEGDPNAQREWEGDPQNPENAEQMEGDPNAQRDWEGDPQNPENAEQMEGDPNAQREWDGEPMNPENAQQMEGDPNAQREWDGQTMDQQNMEQQQGEWNKDQNSQWDGQTMDQENMQQQQGEWNKDQNSQWDGKKNGEEMQQQQQGQQQQQQQGDQQQQQQGQQQQQQQGDQQQQQQGQQQQQQQGQQQQQQQGQQQQQQGQQQQQNPMQQNPMQQAQQHAQQAANQMKQQAQQMAQQMNVPLQQMNQNQQQQQQQGGQQQNKNQQNQQQQNQNQQNQQNQDQQDPNSKSAGQGKHQNKPANHSVPLFLQDTSTSNRDWTKAKGNLSNQSDNDGYDAEPEEYKDLVKTYFEELSKQAQ